MHRELGLQSEIIDAKELRRLAPCLDTKTVRMAVNLRDGGVAPHHAAMKGFLKAARRLGVVDRVRQGRDCASSAATSASPAIVAGGERIPADIVLLASGAQSAHVAKLANVAIDAFPQRIEAMALEPVRPILRPAIALPDRLCYLHQTARGEIVGGSEVPERPQDTLATDLPGHGADGQDLRRDVPGLLAAAHPAALGRHAARDAGLGTAARPASRSRKPLGHRPAGPTASRAPPARPS